MPVAVSEARLAASPGSDVKRANARRAVAIDPVGTTDVVDKAVVIVIDTIADNRDVGEDRV